MIKGASTRACVWATILQLNFNTNLTKRNCYAPGQTCHARAHDPNTGKYPWVFGLAKSNNSRTNRKSPDFYRNSTEVLPEFVNSSRNIRLYFLRKFRITEIQNYRNSIYRNSPEFTGIHRNSPEFTEIHRNSPEFTGIHCNSPEFTGIHRKKGSSSFWCKPTPKVITFSPSNLNLNKKVFTVKKDIQDIQNI